MPALTKARAEPKGRRLGDGVAVIDIGSNSVRLVIYERASRAPTVMFNEKVAAALGEGVGADGRLKAEAMGRALFAIRRFVALATAAEVTAVTLVATEAVRAAANAAAFIADIETVAGTPVRVLDGEGEARMAAAGVLCGFWRPDGVVGDLGGGSLELIDVSGEGIGAGQSFALGTLRLAGDAEDDLSRGHGLVTAALQRSQALRGLEGRTFYAVGGTWRSLVKLHMALSDYPLSIVHQYAVGAEEMEAFCDEVLGNGLSQMDKGGVVSRGRRALVPWGALVLKHVIALGRPSRVVASALGVREGTIFEGLEDGERGRDPLIVAAEELALLRSRSPLHAAEAVGFTERMLAALALDEDEEQRRLRIAACLLSDISWRSHPDYRADQALAVVSNVALYGVNHAGRGFLAHVLNERYGGARASADAVGPQTLCSPEASERARLLAAMLRVAYVLAPGVPGVLPRVEIARGDGSLTVTLPVELASFDGERPLRRVRQLAKLVGLEGTIRLASGAVASQGVAAAG